MTSHFGIAFFKRSAPAAVTATIYYALGVDPRTRIPGLDGRPTALADAEPIAELF